MSDFKKEISNWKKQGLNPVQVAFSDDNVAFFQTPTRKKLGLIFSKAGKGGPISMTEAYVKNCYLGGSVSLETVMDDNNTAYIAELAASIDDLLNTKKAEVKKL